MIVGDYFALFSSCIAVLGAKEMCICDLERDNVYKFPTELGSLLNHIKDIRRSYYSSHFDPDTSSTLYTYIEYLINHELGHWCDNPEWFPDIDLEWEFPALITNAIIELNHNKTVLIELVQQLNSLNCKALEIRVFCSVDLEDISFIVQSTLDTGIQSLQLYLASDPKLSKNVWIDIITSNPRLHYVAVYGSADNDLFRIENNYVVDFISGGLSNKRCGHIDQNNFAVNLSTFSEAQIHNTCLNRKIAIDTDGSIKNCPSMSKSYGNIKDTTLAEAIEKPGFKKYWNIRKDQIEVCKDCEFRYICTDCRAYTENPHDTSGPDGTNVSKPLKCGYNPYTGEWSEWSTNPLKEKAIEFYGMEDLVRRD